MDATFIIEKKNIQRKDYFEEKYLFFIYFYLIDELKY